MLCGFYYAFHSSHLTENGKTLFEPLSSSNRCAATFSINEVLMLWNFLFFFSSAQFIIGAPTHNIRCIGSGFANGKHIEIFITFTKFHDFHSGNNDNNKNAIDDDDENDNDINDM